MVRTYQPEPAGCSSVTGLWPGGPGMKNKKDKKVGVRRSCISWCLMSEVQRLIYSLQGKMGQNQQKAIIQWDEVSRRLIKECCLKRNSGYLKCVTDWAHRGLGIDNFSSFGGGFKFPGSEVTVPPRPWLQAITSLAKHIPGFRQGIIFLLHVSGHQEKHWITLVPNPSLLLKTPYTWVIEQGKIKLTMTWKLHPLWLAFIL